MSSSYRDLLVWQKAMDLSEAIYQATRSFPKEERYGLVAQMRRASVSVASNIAEGQGRLTTGEFRHFPGVARGSLLELETQVLLAGRPGMLIVSAVENFVSKSDEIKRMLHGLAESLSERASSTRN